MEKPGQKAEQVSREDTLLSKKLVRLAIAVGVVLVVALLVSLGFALRWYLSPKTDLSISQRQDLVQGLASVAQAAAVGLTGAAGFIGLAFTWRNLRQTRESTQETLQLTEQGQITDRFTHAIDQLGATNNQGHPRLEIRLGGIYALERIARDSPEREYSTVMEVLTAYVRENSTQAAGSSTGSSEAAAPSNEAPAAADEEAKQQAALPVPRPPAADIQAILDVLSRAQPRVPEEYRTRLDIHEATLQRADLEGANLQEAILWNADLQYAYLWRADLRGADFRGAKLNGAALMEADLQRADLDRAYLYEAALNLAKLNGAKLNGADLQYAQLYRADLQGVDLSGAFNLTQEQIEWAIGSDETELPENLSRPVQWSKSIEEQERIVTERAVQQGLVPPH